MLFRQMKYFIAVVEAHSFTEASYALEISQSAVSQQIKALEDDLGVPLLVRQNRTFSLTPAGEYFYRHGKELLQEIDTPPRRRSGTAAAAGLPQQLLRQ